MKSRKSFLFTVYAGIYDKFMRFFRFDDLVPILTYFEGVTGKKICDVGGGTGVLANELVQRGNEVTILDPCISMTNIAIQRNPRIKILTGTVEECLKKEEYDYVIFKDVLHHIPKQSLALKVSRVALKPGGYLIIQEFSPKYIGTKCIFAFERFCLEKIRPVSEEWLAAYNKRLKILGKIHVINTRDYIYVGRKTGK